MRRSTDLMQLLTHAERLLAQRLTVILQAEGHTLDAWRVITALADGRGHFMTELADRAFLPPASLTRLVDHLVDENLLYRRVDDVDRRRIRAYLTPRGQRFYQRIGREVQGSLAALPVPADDQARLERLLTTLIDGLATDRDHSPLPTAAL
jgi:DNA-binding MarR family transcriptional regulator